MEGVIALLIPIIVSLGFFTMIVLLARKDNDLKKRMVEAGMNPYEKQKNKFNSPAALKWGFLLIGFGLALFLARILESTLDFNGDTEAIYFGLIGIFGGIGLVLAHRQARKEEREDRDHFIH